MNKYQEIMSMISPYIAGMMLIWLTSELSHTSFISNLLVGLGLSLATTFIFLVIELVKDIIKEFKDN